MIHKIGNASLICAILNEGKVCNTTFTLVTIQWQVVQIICLFD